MADNYLTYINVDNKDYDIRDKRLAEAQGTAGQLLSTDGSGNLSWVNPPEASVSQREVTSMISGYLTENPPSATLAKKLTFTGATSQVFDGTRDVEINIPTGGGSSGGGSTIVSNTVEFYGAKGDGVTDDTAAIQSAIDTTSSKGGGVVFLTPGKKYFITNTITIKPNVVLDGITKRSTIYAQLMHKPAIYVVGIEGEGIDYRAAGNMGIRNLTIEGRWDYEVHSKLRGPSMADGSDQRAKEYVNAQGTETYTGLQIGLDKQAKYGGKDEKDVNGIYFSEFHDIDIYGFGVGIRTYFGTWVLRMHHIQIRKCFHGFWDHSSDNYYEAFYITDCPGDGLHVSWSGNCRYTNLMIERCGGASNLTGDGIPTDKNPHKPREYYGLNIVSCDNNGFTNVTVIENNYSGAYIQNAENTSFNGMFAFENGWQYQIEKLYKEDSASVLANISKKHAVGFKIGNTKNCYGVFHGSNVNPPHKQYETVTSVGTIEHCDFKWGDMNALATSHPTGNSIVQLGTGSSGGGSSSGGSSYGIATASTAGLVKPTAKTSTMTQPVGVDSTGQLFTAPTTNTTTTISGGGSGGRTSWYTGKQVVCFGDSITSKATWQSTGDGMLWRALLNYKYNGTRAGAPGQESLLMFKPYGGGGLTSATLCASESGDTVKVDGERVTPVEEVNLNSLPTNAPVYIVEMGINDWLTLNISSAKTIEDGITAYKANLTKLAIWFMHVVPTAMVIWFTPHYCNPAANNRGEASLELYADAMIEVARTYGIPCIDMYHECGWSYANWQKYMIDNVHPNELGGQRIYAKIAAKLDELEPIFTDKTTMTYGPEGSKESAASRTDGSGTSTGGGTSSGGSTGGGGSESGGGTTPTPSGDVETEITDTSFTKKNYITSSGTQYIDTGFNPNGNTTVEVEIPSGFQDYINKTNGIGFGVLFSAMEGVQTDEANVREYGLTNSASNSALYPRYFNMKLQCTTTADSGTFKLDKGSVYMNNNLVQSGSYYEYSIPYPLYIFGRNDNGSFGSYPASGVKISRFTIYDNGTLVRNLIPAVDSSSVPCMYDTVTKKAYYNKGTGAFTVG